MDNKHSDVACPKCGTPLAPSKSNRNRGALKKCPTCRQRNWYEKNKDRVKADSNAYYRKTAERRKLISRQNYHALSAGEKKRLNRKNALKRKYGITPEQYDAMFTEQNGLCFLCGNPSSPDKPLSVDHCHANKTVRKLLCQTCNFFLGKVERDPSWIDRARQYLKE